MTLAFLGVWLLALAAGASTEPLLLDSSEEVALGVLVCRSLGPVLIFAGLYWGWLA